MKKIFFVIAAIVVSLLLHSCGNDYNDVLEIDNSIIQTRALNVDSIDKGEIIPVPESPHKRKDLSLYFINENSSFPTNICASGSGFKGLFFNTSECNRYTLLLAGFGSAFLVGLT